MRRAHVAFLMAVAGAGLMLLVVSAMIQGFSQAAPLAQVTVEVEPNDSCSDANHIGLALPVQGIIQPITDTDYFTVETEAGVPYIASASVGPAQFNVRLCIYAPSGDGNWAQMSCSSASSSYVEQSWDAISTVHCLKMEKYGTALITHTTSYVLEAVERFVTPIPTSTPTHTPTPPPSVSEADPYETYYGYSNNNARTRAYTMPVTTYLELSDHLGVANFYPDGKEDLDWFAFWAKDGKWYQITTSNLSGVDTFLDIYRLRSDGSAERITGNDDGGGGYASQVTFEASSNAYYYIRVRNKVDTTGSYDMTLEETDAPPPTSTPEPGPGPQGDDCEDNLDFAHACVIPPDEPLTFNLFPPYGSGTDNDYFKLWVKPDFLYECSTSFLDPGVDTNMILFYGPSNDALIGGNDDDPRPDAEDPLGSYLAYYATYEGWMYILVGTGDRTPSDLTESNYTLKCEMTVPGEPTPTNTPLATSPAPTSPPTPTPKAGLSVRSLTTPTPVPGAEPGETPVPRFVPIDLLVYYDSNDDGQAGAGEGIAGISVQAYEAATNQLLDQGSTDDQGRLELTVSAQGPVRVSIPFFGFSQLVTGEEASIRLRVPSQPLLEGGP